MAVKYSLSTYERYPIYEPAEGGYYYEGCQLQEWETFDTKEDAIRTLRELVNAENENLTCQDEGYMIIIKDIYAQTINHRYIGEGFECYVEPINRRGRHAQGRVPYC